MKEWSIPDQWQHHHVLTGLGIVGLQMSLSGVECTCPNQYSLLVNQAVVDVKTSLNALVVDSSVAPALASSWPCDCIATSIVHNVNCYCFR